MQESCCRFWPTKSEGQVTFGSVEVTYKKTIQQEHWDGINLILRVSSLWANSEACSKPCGQ